MDETGISKAEQVTLLKGLIEEGVRQKREMVFKHREAFEEMLRFGVMIAFLLSIGLVSILRDALVTHGLESGNAGTMAVGNLFGGLVDIFFLIIAIVVIAFGYMFLRAFSKYSSPIRMKDGSELSFKEAAASIDSQTKRNFHKLIEIRQGMTPAEADATRIEPYRFDTVNSGYYVDVVRLTVPQIEKNKEEINERRTIVVRDLDEVRIHRKANMQLMIIAIAVAIASRILDGPFANLLPTGIWKVWMVLSYLMFYAGITMAVFFGIRFLYEKKDNHMIPSITLIDRYETSIENYNYLLTDIEFMLVCAQRRKDPSWNKPVIDVNETKTISMAELTEAVAEAESVRQTSKDEVRPGPVAGTAPKAARKDDPYDLSYGNANIDIGLSGSFAASASEPIDLMPDLGSPASPQERIDEPSGVQEEGRVERPAPTAGEPAAVEEPIAGAKPIPVVETPVSEETDTIDAAEAVSEGKAEEQSEEEIAAEDKKKLEEYMRDLKRKAQEEAEFSAELENEMERIRRMPQEEIVEEKTEAPQHPASSNLFYYPTADTREQAPFVDQEEPGNSYINHSAHAAAELAGEEPAAFRHRTGGEKDKYNYDGRPKKSTVLRRAAMSSDQDPVTPVEVSEEETPIRPAPEAPKAEEKKASLRTSDEFTSSMTEHIRSLQEEYGKRDTASLDLRNASTGEGSNVRMDREQGLTISLEDALKDLESFADDED